MERVSKVSRETVKKSTVSNIVLDTPIDKMKELPNEELQEIIEAAEADNDFDDSYCEAVEILKERLKELTKKERASFDDGTIKGMLINGDYLKVNAEVYIQYLIKGENKWVIQVNEDLLGGAGFRQKTLAPIAFTENTIKCISAGYLSDYKSAEMKAKDIATVCKRRINKKDIVLAAMDHGSFADGFTNGYIFTEDKLYVLKRNELDYIINYSEMENADIDREKIKLSVKDDEEVIFEFSSFDRDYAEEMYNLFMDIIERIHSGNDK